MVRLVSARLVVAAALLFVRDVLAAEVSLTLDQALTLARERGPAALAARARIDEAKGRRAGAAVLFRENPNVEILVGQRSREAGSAKDLELAVEQVLEQGGRRGSRIRGADAAIARESANAEDAIRLLQLDVANAFYRLQHADRRVGLAKAADEVTRELQDTAQRRFQAGDIAELDVNLARVAAARARAEVGDEEADRVRAAAELKALLGLSPDDDTRAQGDLRVRPRFEREELLESAGRRPDLVALAAEKREAEAEVAFGKGFQWPDLGLRAEFHREAEEDVLLGGLSLRLPLFERGQELRQTGRARMRRVADQASSLRNAAAIDVEAALAAFALLEKAVDGFEGEAVPRLDDSELLARKSFTAGQLGVADYLVVRRELLEARKAYLDQLLDMGAASARVDFAAGVLR